jgi:aminocarboxymuconate-semialdehyde decarboxylase
MPKKKTFAIDTHAHIVVPEIGALMKKYATNAGNDARSWEGGTITERHFDRKLRLKDMNKGRIDMQVISTGLPAQCQWTDREGARALMRVANESVAGWVGVDPDRFVGIGTVLLHDVPLAIEELDYAVNSLGLRGMMSLTNIRGRDLGEKEFWPFWAALEKAGVPIFLHPHGFTQPERLQKFKLSNTVGQPLEHTLAMASLIHEGVMEAFPKLKVHFAHGGGYLPFYSGRSDSTHERDPSTRENIKHKPSWYMKKFWYDTVIFDQRMIEYLADRVGENRVMLGSDYPWRLWDAEGMVSSSKKISREAKERILWKNAASLYGIKV